jgi:hypothetical protein
LVDHAERVHLPIEHVRARKRGGVGEVRREAGAVNVREGDAEDDEVRVGGRGHGARTKRADEGRGKGDVLERSRQAQTTAER